MTEPDAREFVLSRCTRFEESQVPRRGVSAERLALEKQVAEILPPELVEWLPYATKAAPDERGSIEHFNNFGGLVSFFSSGSHLNRICPPSIITAVKKWKQDWLHRGWLPIAGDGCGDYCLLIEHAPGKRIVVFWDQSNSTDEYDYVYASSLWHFLAGALQRPRGRWPFFRKNTMQFDPGMGELVGVRFAWDRR
jgi:hypothetical protein